VPHAYAAGVRGVPAIMPLDSPSAGEGVGGGGLVANCLKVLGHLIGTHFISLPGLPIFIHKILQLGKIVFKGNCGNL
jgi:hypothetical protein